MSVEEDTAHSEGAIMQRDGSCSSGYMRYERQDIPRHRTLSEVKPSHQDDPPVGQMQGGKLLIST